MNVSKVFSIPNVIAAGLFGVGLFGMHLAQLMAVVIYIPSRSVTMPFRALVLGGACLAICYALNKRYSFYRGRLWLALLIFWAFYALSILFEPAMMLQQSRSSYAQYAFGVCAIPSFAYMLFTNHKTIVTGKYWMLLAGLLAGSLSIVLYGGASLHGTGRAKVGEFIGDYVAIGPLLLSYTGSALVVWAVYWLLVRESNPSRILRLMIAGALVAIGAYLMALGASRGPVVAVFVVGVVFMLARARKASDILVVIIGIIAMVGVGALLLMFADKMGSALVMRLKSLTHIHETYMHGNIGVGRIGIYQATINQFFGNPILGNGLYCRAAGSYPHNFILEAYMTTGFFGGTAFLIFFCSCVSRSIKLIRYFPAHSWVAILFLHYAVYVQFSSSLITNHYFWYIAGMVIAVFDFCSKGQLHSPLTGGRFRQR